MQRRGSVEASVTRVPDLAVGEVTGKLCWVAAPRLGLASNPAAAGTAGSACARQRLAICMLSLGRDIAEPLVEWV
jgi:hypothetical protein